MVDVSQESRDFIPEVCRIWDAKAEFWDELMGFDGNEFHRTVVRSAQNAMLSLRPTEIVLDIGCGTGLAARELARSAKRVVAFDLSPRMIELARRRASAEGIDNIDYL